MMTSIAKFQQLSWRERDWMMLPPRCVAGLLLVMFAASVGQSQLPSDLRAQLWPAKWITSDDAPARDEAVLYFRKSVAMASVPQHFVVRVSADNRFVLYVNGQRVGSGPARSDLSHWKYETFDVAPMLRSGANVFAAVVWNFGARSALAQISDRTAFLLSGVGDAESAVNTGTDWEVMQEKGFARCRNRRSWAGITTRQSRACGWMGRRSHGAGTLRLHRARLRMESRHRVVRLTRGRKRWRSDRERNAGRRCRKITGN
jgi:hypothetical protein